MRTGAWTRVALAASLAVLGSAAEAGIPTDQLRGATDRVLQGAPGPGAQATRQG